MKELSRESRALLAEARRAEHISAAEKSRIHGKLAQRIGAGLAIGSALTATATAAEAAHTGAWASALAWLPAAAKVVGVVAVTGAVSVGVVTAVRVAPHSANTLPRAPVAAVAPAPTAVRVAPNPVAPTPEEVTPPRLDTAQAAVLPPPVRAKRIPIENTSAPEQPLAPSQDASAHPVADHLSRQVTAIREARVAIRGGDARAALAALDRELPEGGAGALAPEAALARVAAYCRLGDIESARRVANRFAAQYPQSPLVVRMRESCAGTPNQRGVTNF